jgi:hypothetical protein
MANAPIFFQRIAEEQQTSHSDVCRILAETSFA